MITIHTFTILSDCYEHLYQNTIVLRPFQIYFYRLIALKVFFCHIYEIINKNRLWLLLVFDSQSTNYELMYYYIINSAY